MRSIFRRTTWKENAPASPPRLIPQPAQSYGRPYQYASLPSGDCIRYLELAPGTGSEPLLCSLRIITLSKNHTFDSGRFEAKNSLPFEALSYVWGNQEKTKEIICEGQILKITANLHEALTRVRLPTDFRNLWADSICIDQSDLKEQGIQVLLMGKVYSFAKATLIWLGPDHGNGEAVQSLVEEVGNKISAERINGGRHGSVTDFDPLAHDVRWESFKVMRDCAWFSRVWVVQEACLSRGNAFVMYGGAEFLWTELNRVEKWMSEKGDVITSKYEIIPMNWIHQGDVWKEARVDSSFLRFLEATKHLEATDPRDHIYAMLGSPYTRAARAARGTGNSGLFLEPNYERPYLEVYYDFAVQYLENLHDLSLLVCVEHDARSIACDFPSWVPRWNRTFQRYRLLPYPSDTPQIWSPRRRLIEDSELNVGAIIWGQIQILSSTLSQPNWDLPSSRYDNSNQFVHLWRRICGYGTQFGARRDSSSDHVQQLLSFIETLEYGGGEDSNTTFLANQAAYCLRLCEQAQVGDVNLTDLRERAQWGDGDADAFDRFVARYYSNRKFVIYQQDGKEFYGLVPQLAELGDIICKISGAPYHFVLRNMGRRARYRLIGVAFVKSVNYFKDPDEEGIVIC